MNTSVRQAFNSPGSGYDLNSTGIRHPSCSGNLVTSHKLNISFSDRVRPAETDAPSRS